MILQKKKLLVARRHRKWKHMITNTKASPDFLLQTIVTHYELVRKKRLEEAVHCNSDVKNPMANICISSLV